MSHATLEAFDYPDSLIREYPHWAVLLRPAQVTVGSLVLVCREEATSFSTISFPAFSEMSRVVTDIEATLSAEFGYDKLNYLMLMMKDPQVHFHVLPRYGRPVLWEGVTYMDHHWPGPPDVTSAVELAPESWQALKERLIAAWPS